MNNSCVVRAHGAGLFSNINKVITCMEMYWNVRVDWSNPDNFYKVPEGHDQNLWNHLFEPIGQVLDEPTDDIINYPHQRYTYKEAHALYQAGDDWRHELNKHWKKLQIKSQVADRSLNLSGTTIGVLVRSSAIAGEQISDRNASLDEYVRATKKLIDQNDSKRPRIYAACSDHESSMRFVKEFSATIHPWTRRAENRSIDFHAQHPQNVNDAINCVGEVLTLSRCDFLIHQVSNMATAALYINPSLTSVYLQ